VLVDAGAGPDDQGAADVWTTDTAGDSGPDDGDSAVGDGGEPEGDATGPADVGPAPDVQADGGAEIPDVEPPSDSGAQPDLPPSVDLGVEEDLGAGPDTGSPQDAAADGGSDDLGGPVDLGAGVLSCGSDEDCPLPSVCRLLPDPEDPFFTLPQCGAPVGEGAAGQLCASDPECLSGTCLPAGSCFGACADGVGCARNLRCGEASLVLDDRGTDDPADDVVQQVQACMPAPGRACEVDEDCDAPQLCQPRAGDADTIELRCGDPVGPAEGGAACVEDGECATGLCLEGHCYQACRDVADCPEAWICGRLLVAVDGGPQPILAACLPRPPECEADVDCGPDGACLPYGDVPAGALVGLCLGRHGDVPAGGLCVEDQDCRTGQCMEIPGGGRRCLGLCRVQADCAAGTRCYPDQLYLDLAPGAPEPLFDALPACTLDVGSGSECTRDGDCPGSEICLPLPDGARESFRLVCRDPFHPLGFGPGEGCFMDSMCASGYCVPVFGVAGFCLGVCATDDDCAVDTTCSGEQLRDGGFDPDSERDDLVGEVPLCVP